MFRVCSSKYRSNVFIQPYSNNFKNTTTNSHNNILELESSQSLQTSAKAIDSTQLVRQADVLSAFETIVSFSTST